MISTAQSAKATRAWTVGDLAREAGLSRSTFFERFRRAVEITPMDYLLAWRMALAKNLLGRGASGMAEVTETTLYRLWSAQGVEMRPVTGLLRKGLRYAEHAHGERFTIHFASAEPWSKRYRDRLTRDATGQERTILARIQGAVLALPGDEPFV